MMTSDKAKTLLRQWTNLLRDIDAIEIDCEMPPEQLETHLDRRQLVIDRIQQLDAQLLAVRQFRFESANEHEAKSLDALMTEGKSLLATIQERDRQTIDIARLKRESILGRLKNSTLSKGYHAANHTLKIRPPVIVDSKA